MRRHAFNFAPQKLSSSVFCFIVLFGMQGAPYAQETKTINSLAQQVQSQPKPDQQSFTPQNKEIKAALHQELKTLLDENININKEKKTLLEDAEQKAFWIQSLVFFLTAIMVITLISFWRFHAQRIFRRGLDEITTSLRTFQDSVISFIDTTQLDTATTVSSFQAQVPTQAAPRQTTINEPSAQKQPTDFTPPDEVTNTTKGFFDAWLRVYKPGEDYVKQAEAALKNKPKSPDAWLQMIQSFRNTNDYFHFESLRTEIKKFFNIKIEAWNETPPQEIRSIADYPHVQQKIIDAWPGNDIVTVLDRLLLNSRLSAREGFDLALYQNLEGLLSLAKDAQRPLQIADLKEHPVAAFLFAMPTSIANEKPSPSSQIDKAHRLPPASPQVPLELINTATARASIPTAPSSNEVTKQTPREPKPVQTRHEEIKAPQKLEVAQSENRVLLSAYEVRLKLALAYLDIGDTEGACLLLEDVINDAPPDQQRHARKLLSEIEVKRTKYKEIWIG